MDLYLTETKDYLTNNKYNNLTLILGNESCDLDSAVCSLVYGNFLHWQHNKIKCKRCTKVYRDDATYKEDIFVPILNVKRCDVELKTEIVYCFRENGIDVGKLFFRDDYDFNELIKNENKTSVVLVDHHILSIDDRILTPFVEEIIDHRPKDKSYWPYKDDCRSTIEMVGSCATLVCDRIKSLSMLLGEEKDFFNGNPVCAELLHSTIILDTVNFSKEVKKGTPKDEEMVLLLESILKPEDFLAKRKDTLDRLVRARSDVSSLSVAQLLRKDVKVFGDILVPSFPILIEELLKKSNALNDIQSSLLTTRCNIIVLLGMKLNGDEVERDAAFYSAENARERVGQLTKLLEQWVSPSFQLVQTPCNVPNCTYYKQMNKAASRKQYVPVINEFLSKNSL